MADEILSASIKGFQHLHIIFIKLVILLYESTHKHSLLQETPWLDRPQWLPLDCTVSHQTGSAEPLVPVASFGVTLWN